MWMYGEKMWSSGVNSAKNKSSPDMALVSTRRINNKILNTKVSRAHWKRYCFNIVITVTTLGFLPVERAWSSMFDDIDAVVNSVSAAVPAPQHRIDSVM